MIPPLISFVCYNRLGLTSQNLKALLATTDDFELYIVDNGSTDGTWDYLQSVNDPRIKEKKRFDVNRWLIYGINYVISHRKPGQYFICMDNDVYMHTPDFATKFITLLEAFPDLGMVGAIYNNWLEEGLRKKAIISYKEFKKDDLSYTSIYPVVNGCCLCFKPEVLDTVGYFCEETFGADGEMCNRINIKTKWHIGIVPYDYIKITQPQALYCRDCLCKDSCNMSVPIGTLPGCLSLYSANRDKFVEFNKIRIKKLDAYYADLVNNRRTVYCASVHDPESLKNYYYNKEWAEENFDYFIKLSQNK